MHKFLTGMDIVPSVNCNTCLTRRSVQCYLIILCVKLGQCDALKNPENGMVTQPSREVGAVQQQGRSYLHKEAPLLKTVKRQQHFS